MLFVGLHGYFAVLLTFYSTLVDLIFAVEIKFSVHSHYQIAYGTSKIIIEECSIYQLQYFHWRLVVPAYPG